MPWMSNNARPTDKAIADGGQIRGVGQVRAAPDPDAGPAPSVGVDEVRAVGGSSEASVPQEGGGPRGNKKRPRFAWRSLKEDHLRLAREGYEGPPALEYPAEYVSHNRRALVGNRKLTDEEVGWLRANPDCLTLRERAEKLGVTYEAARQAANGTTYRRLSLRYPPRI